MNEKIILDVDTGTDDAIALCAALLSKDLDVLGICTVGGNVVLKNTTDNTLRVVTCCRRSDVPVHAGAPLPMVSTLQPWIAQAKSLPRKEGQRSQETAIHVDHLPLPETALKAQDTCACVYLIETLNKAADHSITLVPTGPMTNIALALRANPSIADKIKRIVMMGGTRSVYPDTQAAEFNVWCDPEALEIVLQSGIDLTMVSLDATSHACLNARQAQQIREIHSAPAELCAALIEHRLHASAAHGDTKGTGVGAALHDALAVCALVHPEVLKIEDVSCHVDLGHGFAYGETVLGRNYTEENWKPTVTTPSPLTAASSSTGFTVRLRKDQSNRRLENSVSAFFFACDTTSCGLQCRISAILTAASSIMEG